MTRSLLRDPLAALAVCVLAALVALAVAQASWAASPGPPAVSGLVSPSHPAAGTWYADRDPSFVWRGELATPALAGFSYLLDQDPVTVPGTTVDLAPLSFTAPVVSPLPALDAGLLLAGDLNGDRLVDLMVPGHRDGTLAVLSGRGNGRFVASHSIFEGLGRTFRAVADLNHDGKLDLITSALVGTRERGSIGVQLGRGNGTFRSRRDYLLGYFDSAAMGPVVVADVNGDHKRDVVTAVGTRLIVLPGRGDGTFGPEQISLGQAGDARGDAGFLHGLALGDLNGDGRLDVVATGQDDVNTPIGFFSVGLGSGNGHFKTAATTISGESVPGRVALADLNHDGHSDLVVQNDVDLLDYVGEPDYSAVVVSSGNGHGAFTRTSEYDFAPQQSPGDFQLADFNRDGDLDLGFATDSGVDVLLGDGHAGFQPGLQFGQTGAGVAVVADFDRDGEPDLAVVPTRGSTVTAFLDRSDQAAYSGVADGVWYFHVQAVDVDGVGGPAVTRAVRIDTQRPVVRVSRSARVKRGSVAHLGYVVDDPPPCAGWCNVRIVVEDRRGAVRLVLHAGHIHNNVGYRTAFRCRLPKGAYSSRVTATDAAGNRSAVAIDRLTVN